MWYAVDAEYIDNEPAIDTQYFKLHKRMKDSNLDDAQKLVDSIIFDTDWIGVKVKDFEEQL